MKALTALMRALVVGGIATLPAFSFAAPAADANSATTPGMELSKDTALQSVAPYVAPANVYVPDSSIELPGDAGVRAHTNYVIKNPKGIRPSAITDLRQAEPHADIGPDSTFAEYPASLSCLYKMGPTYAGCAPTNNSAYNAVGGSRAIAVVIAYDNPTVLSDLQNFSAFFGLPAPSFKKVIANGNGACVTPPFNAGWALEGAMDTQWAHAMAPAATIIYVEACSNSYADLMYAEQIAAQQLLPYGGGQVTNSWGSGEFPTESTDWDWVFRANWVAGKPISYFFSAGDAGLGAQYPSSSPWVISAGGTTINRDPNTQAFISESCWPGSGGGISAYETYSSTFGSGTGPWTNYQYPLFGQASRRTPDMSFDADPASGAWVLYDNSWYVVGGTSLSAPALAGIVNNSNNRLGVAPSPGGYYSNMEDNLLYAQLATYKEYKTNFYDVKTGSNGAPATVGWDTCTGVGSPRGKLGK
ncbi:MAG TPA: S53 family peptidase [Ideonella sp.]|nr:S53 family peptidase [Ideonella sp.]